MRTVANETPRVHAQRAIAMISDMIAQRQSGAPQNPHMPDYEAGATSSKRTRVSRSATNSDQATPQPTKERVAKRVASDEKLVLEDNDESESEPVPMSGRRRRALASTARRRSPTTNRTARSAKQRAISYAEPSSSDDEPILLSGGKRRAVAPKPRSSTRAKTGRSARQRVISYADPSSSDDVNRSSKVVKKSLGKRGQASIYSETSCSDYETNEKEHDSCSLIC